MENEKEMQEVIEMTNKQTEALLEAIKIIAESSESREDFLEKLERVQKKVTAEPDKNDQ